MNNHVVFLPPQAEEPGIPPLVQRSGRSGHWGQTAPVRCPQQRTTSDTAVYRARRDCHRI